MLHSFRLRRLSKRLMYPFYATTTRIERAGNRLASMVVGMETQPVCLTNLVNENMTVFNYSVSSIGKVFAHAKYLSTSTARESASEIVKLGLT